MASPNLSPNTAKTGILLCVMSTACIALQDSMSKALLPHFTVAQIVFARQCAFLLFVFWLLSRQDGAGGSLRAFARARSVPAQLLRSTLYILEMAVFCLALRYVGIAEAHAVFMLFPIIATLLARPLLGESFTRRKGIALALGFAGALLIFRPGSGAFDPAQLITLSAAALYALYNIITRSATAQDGLHVSLAYMGAVGFALSMPLGIAQWNSVAPPSIWLLLAGISGTGIVTHVLIVKSLQYAPASLLQPYNYTLVGWALLAGWLFYDELLHLPDYLGIAIVLAAGLYMLGDKTRDS